MRLRTHRNDGTRGIGPLAILVTILAMTTFLPSSEGQEGAVQRVHDPHIIREGDSYYIFSTGPGIPIRRSKDLFRWQVIGRVFDEVPRWARDAVPGVRSLWAPDISHFNGEFRLYYSISTFGRNRSCIGLATNKTLDPQSKDYRWVDHGKVMMDGGGTLVLESRGHVRGPGHNSALLDGEKDWLVHHYYDARASGVPTLQVRPLLWADDGWNPLPGHKPASVQSTRAICPTPAHARWPGRSPGRTPIGWPRRDPWYCSTSPWW